MKDHELAALVGRLTSIAREFGQTQQLRERIAKELRPVAAEGFGRGAIAYQLTKRLVIDIPTARAAVDAAFEDVKSDQTDPTWIGCGECDVAFGCHGGEAKCIRLEEGSPIDGPPTTLTTTAPGDDDIIEWTDPWGEGSEPMVHRMLAKDVASARRRDDPRYQSDQEAIDDFITIHWAQRLPARITFTDWVTEQDPMSGFCISDAWSPDELKQAEMVWNAAVARGK